MALNTLKLTSDSSVALTNEILSALYKAVYLPIEGALNTRRLIVVPHGSLHYLPFHALYNGYSHLVERCEISYAPSVSVLQTLQAFKKEP
jgi:CHAT domain-containing protein